MRLTKCQLFLAGLNVMLILGCSHYDKAASQMQNDAEICPVRISAVSDSFKTAAHVKLVFTPSDLTEIQVLTPLSDSFEVLRPTLGVNRSRFGEEESVNLKGKSFKAHKISWGLPGDEWYGVSNSRQPGVFEILPGEYLIRIRYAPGQGKRPDHLCFAETDVFSVEEKSLLVSSHE